MIVKKSKKTWISLLLVLTMLLTAQAAGISSVIPIGHTVGIAMDADGVLVVRLSDVQTEKGAVCPAKNAGIAVGDLISSVNGQRITGSEEMQKQIALSAGADVMLTLLREGSEKQVKVRPCRDIGGAYRIGVLTRDSIAGIGTLTYVDPETGAYGSLGHAVCENETGVMIPLEQGRLLRSTVGSVQQGKAGQPGALQGEFEAGESIGTITENTASGIFGKLTDSSLYVSMQEMPVATTEEIKTGPAKILANVSGDAVAQYDAEIVRLFPENDEYGRGMMLHVTDGNLIRQTGGIVQGMSGSPVLQNGKIVGAVTHVLVENPEYGYAITIENMLDEMTD